MTTENLCLSCQSLCCKPRTLLELSPQEADLLRRHNTKLAELFPKTGVEIDVVVLNAHKDLVTSIFYQLEPGNGLFVLSSECGYVVKRNGSSCCAIHEDPRRPRICVNFEAGSPDCLKMRAGRGLD